MLNRYFKRIILPIFILSFQITFHTANCIETSLVDFSTWFLKGLPEFIGKDPKKTTPSEMKVFYKSDKEWDKNLFTLKSNDLDGVFEDFIENFSKDSNYNNASKWVSKVEPPKSLFDFSKNPAEIAYPYIQKVVVPAGSIIFFIGDTHGSPHSLLRTLWRWRVRELMDNNFKIKKNYYFVILGDYADRGNGTSELWYMLTTLKLKNWNQVFIIRGNHDVWAHHQAWGHSTFLSELDYKFGDAEKFKNKIKCAYNLLPHALLIGTENDFILCAHGGADATYNAVNLLHPDNSYEFLSAKHNFAYDSAAHGDWTKNTFMARIYSGDPKTKPIDTDINALTTQYSSGSKKTHLIVRGHQHSEMPDCFCLVKKGYPVGKDPISTLLPSWQAKNNVKADDRSDILDGTFKPSNTEYYSIYTFFSATGNHNIYDCFGSIKVAEKFSDWTFKLYQRDLDTNKTLLRKFARLELYNGKEIRTVYSKDKTPFPEPLSKDLRKFAGD